MPYIGRGYQHTGSPVENKGERITGNKEMTFQVNKPPLLQLLQQPSPVALFTAKVIAEGQEHIDVAK